MATLAERLEGCNQNITAGKEAIVASLQAIGFTEVSMENTFQQLANFIKKCQVIEKED